MTSLDWLNRVDEAATVARLSAEDRAALTRAAGVFYERGFGNKPFHVKHSQGHVMKWSGTCVADARPVIYKDPRKT